MADNSILLRLDGLKLKYEETGQKLTDPEVIADVKQFVQLTKEYKELEPIIETSERYRTALANLAEAKDILANDKDEEMREMARMEIAELEPALEKMEEDIKLLLIPKDPQDDKNAILEIRGGTGGDEAAIFAGDLLRMYTKYIESKGWRYEITSFSDGAAGGYKEVVLKVSGQSVYGTLKNESGSHYDACEKCIHFSLSGGYYITDYGEKYHSSLSSSGLKRTVYSVEKGSVVEMGGCSKCTK